MGRWRSAEPRGVCARVGEGPTTHQTVRIAPQRPAARQRPSFIFPPSRFWTALTFCASSPVCHQGFRFGQTTMIFKQGHYRDERVSPTYLGLGLIRLCGAPHSRINPIACPPRRSDADKMSASSSPTVLGIVEEIRMPLTAGTRLGRLRNHRRHRRRRHGGSVPGQGHQAEPRRGH